MRVALTALAMLIALVLSANVRAAEVTAPQRVVSLSPSTTDLLVELGGAAQLLAMVDAGERPHAVKHALSLGRYTDVSAEQLLALNPDLVLLWDGGETPRLLAQLQALEVPLWVATPKGMADIPRQLRDLGARLGRAERGEWLAKRFTERQAQLTERYQRVVPLRVFYQVWHRPMYTLGGPQPITDALRVCGARNVFASLSQAAPVVSPEAVLAANPDVIILGSDDAAQNTRFWQQYPQLAAAQKQQIWLLDTRQLERPSFQMIDAVERLCEVLKGAQ